MLVLICLTLGMVGALALVKRDLVKNGSRKIVAAALVVALIIVMGAGITGCSRPEPSKTGNGQASQQQTDNGPCDEQEDPPEQEEEEEETEPTLAEPKFEPMQYTGSGDSIVLIDNVGEAAIAYIKGNAAERHFAVTGYDTNRNYLDLLVNTTSAYEGIVLLDAKTAEFEVNATGDWEIEVRSLVSARVVCVTGEVSYADHAGGITGRGDEVVIVVSTVDAPITNISGNNSERHFAISAYGESTELLVNTIDAYSGTVRLPSGEFVILEITAEGEWAIDFDY